MNRLKKRRHNVEHDNVDRWLVSYADYMTLLFALFVVLYAMAMVNDKPFETVTESIGRVFQADKDKTKNLGHGDDILPVNTSKTEKRLYGDGILVVNGPELVDGKKDLSNIAESNVGSQLESLEEQLNTALFDLIESGHAKLEIDGDWLEIELSSGLLFPSGSATATNAARSILSVINDIIGGVSNFIRVRGYTDNQAINTEIFSSNWELSVARATAILRELEALSIDPARMAIEGYGQYYPASNNNTELGREKNRRVVLAISKFGRDKENLMKNKTIKIEQLQAAGNNSQAEEDTNSAEETPNEKNKIRVIQLQNGGIRITTRNDEDAQSQE